MEDTNKCETCLPINACRPKQTKKSDRETKQAIEDEESNSKRSRKSTNFPIGQKAVKKAEQAIQEDNNDNWERAVVLYECCVGYFLYSLKHEAKSDGDRDAICKKIKQVQARAANLTSILHKELVGVDRT